MMHAVPVCFHNRPNSGMDYKICNAPTLSSKRFNGKRLPGQGRLKPYLKLRRVLNCRRLDRFFSPLFALIFKKNEEKIKKLYKRE